MLIKPQEINDKNSSAAKSKMKDAHTGSLFGRNHKKLAMPPANNLEMSKQKSAVARLVDQ